MPPIVTKLLALGLRQVIGDTAMDLAGGVVGLVRQRFTDHSMALPKALATANDRAWKALAIALAGDQFLDRIRMWFASSDDNGLREQVRRFLDSKPFPFEGTAADFRQACLADLQKARKTKILTPDPTQLDVEEVARQAADFQRFSDPQKLIEGAKLVVAGLAEDLTADYPNLSRLLRQPTHSGPPLLVAAFAYFFRREVETNEELARGLLFEGLQRLSAGQAAAFADVGHVLDALGERFDNLLEQVLAQLGRIEAVAVETHGAVLGLRDEMNHQKEQQRGLHKDVEKLLDWVHLLHRELRPADSLSIRGEAERHMVKQVVARYRALPPEQQRQFPALLNALGKLEVAVGEYQDAERDFESVAQQVSDPRAQAAAHLNAFHAALERRGWDKALKELRQAVALGGPQLAPFPIDRYEAERILGAGGFGVAFLCRHRHSKASVVIKALRADDLARDLDTVFEEANVLEQLQHPAIIRLRDCGYVGSDHTRPYLVMDYFDGLTLEAHVRQNGVLTVPECLHVAWQMAQGLQVAHAQQILHRDIKPGNVLIKLSEGARTASSPRWQVKLIDFGLALQRQTVRQTVSHAEALAHTALGNSITGTIDYAAPEQMGRLPGIAVGPHSDLYSFGKTCCYALFGTPQPGPKQWRHLSEEWLSDLLGDCLAEQPHERPESVTVVLARLDQQWRRKETEAEQEAERRREAEARAVAEQRRRAEAARAEESRRQEEQRQQEEAKRRQEEERRQREAEEQRQREDQERRQQELARLQKEGEASLARLVHEALERTQGRPTPEDTAAADELCKRHRLPTKRAQPIVHEVWRRWQHAHAEARQQAEAARLCREQEEQRRQREAEEQERQRREQAQASAGEEKDIFEIDFEVPALEDESGSQVVALDDEDLNLESADFDLALDEEDASSEEAAKPAPSGNTSSAAKAILEKYMRRPEEQERVRLADAERRQQASSQPLRTWEERRGDQEAAIADSQEPDKNPEPIRNQGDRVGRDDPCPCGSGKKYKNCHMFKDVALLGRRRRYRGSS